MGNTGADLSFEECLEYMSRMYLSDTVELLDNVLSDDESDPQFSAITAVNRFWVYLQYKMATDKAYPIASLTALLEKCGYPDANIALLRAKARAERPIYWGTILAEDFFQEEKP